MACVLPAETSYEYAEKSQIMQTSKSNSDQLASYVLFKYCNHVYTTVLLLY